MGVAPQHLLELDKQMLMAIMDVYKERAKAIENASRGKRRNRA
jgi:hypothetical protein